MIKKFYTIILFLIPLISVTLYGADDSTSYYIDLTIEDEIQSPLNYGYGHRSIINNLNCTINKSGVIFNSTNDTKIEIFELWGDNDICIASFSDEQNFIDFIYKTTGHYKVKFITENHIYYGNIFL